MQLPYVHALWAMAMFSSVFLSVIHSSDTTKTAKYIITKTISHNRYGVQFYGAKVLGEIPMGVTPTVRRIQVG